VKKTLLLKNAIIVDGTGKTPYKGNVLLEDELIKKVGDISENKKIDSVIDLNGAYLTPGFIDMHSHVDLTNFISGEMKPKIMQGITSEVIGQCGVGVAPMPSNKQEDWRKNLILGNPPVKWNWETTAEYLNSLEENGVESNIIPFSGHGVLRYAVKKDKSGSLNDEEIKQIKYYTEEAFNAGIFGLSFGFIYIPALFSDKREIETVLDVASEYKGIIAVHLRSESDELLDAIRDMINYTQNRDCRLHISHLKAIGEKNWDKIDGALKLIEEYGLHFDHYPYCAGSTTLLAVFPPFVVEGNGINDTIDKLQNEGIRERVKKIFSGEEKMEKGLPWDNIPALVGWDNIRIIDVETNKNKEFIGMNIKEIADIKNTTPEDAAMDLITEEHGNVRMIDFYMQEEQLIKIMKNDQGVFGTDSLIGGKAHPRVYGAYPRILNKYVWREKILTIEKAIAKMTSGPAEILGLQKRGYVKPGYFADLIVFNDSFKDCSSYENPKCFPQGLEYVFINGSLKVKEGEFLNNHPGQVIKK
jgi:N-acyl-D-amino-acid deacylase